MGIVQERDRALRERRDQEQRERDRLDKERAERERREREDRERKERELREREKERIKMMEVQRQKQERERQAVEDDVNRHFELSIELARKGRVAIVDGDDGEDDGDAEEKIFVSNPRTRSSGREIYRTKNPEYGSSGLSSRSR